MQTRSILWDGPLDLLSGRLGDEYGLVPWDVGPNADALKRVLGIVAYSHPAVDGPLMDRMLKLENAIILPHLGSASNVTRRRMLTMSIENLEAGLEGRGLPYPV